MPRRADQVKTLSSFYYCIRLEQPGMVSYMAMIHDALRAKHFYRAIIISRRYRIDRVFVLSLSDNGHTRGTLGRS